MNAGELDRYVSIRQLDTSLDSIGGVLEGWSHYAYAWAKWLPTKGREFLAAQTRIAQAVGILRLRYRTDIQTTWRVVVDGVTYEVAAPYIPSPTRGEYIDLILTSVSDSESLAPVSNIFDLSLEVGAVSKVVTYPIPFTSTPQGLYVQLVVPTGEGSFTVTISGESATGFTASFSAAVPVSGYKLSVQAFQNRMSYTEDLVEGDSSMEVVFSPAFPRAPRGVKVSLISPVDGFEFTTALVVKSLTSSGFTLEFGAVVPGPGYKVLIQASL